MKFPPLKHEHSRRLRNTCTHTYTCSVCYRFYQTHLGYWTGVKVKWNSSCSYRWISRKWMSVSASACKMRPKGVIPADRNLLWSTYLFIYLPAFHFICGIQSDAIFITVTWLTETAWQVSESRDSVPFLLLLIQFMKSDVLNLTGM
jgi:hypothetical protein